jgi:pyruvate/2-oxoglutarate dehydrogenase complex dihydrolipoamide acyltransferase (E2) component
LEQFVRIDTVYSTLRLFDLDMPGVPITACCWHAAPGQRVNEGDRLLEIHAGDVTVDLPSPASGILIERCVEIDQPLAVGQVLARIQEDS